MPRLASSPLRKSLPILLESIKKACSGDGTQGDPSDLDRWSEEVAAHFPSGRDELLRPVGEARAKLQHVLGSGDGADIPFDQSLGVSSSTEELIAVTAADLQGWLASGDPESVDLLVQEMSDHLESIDRWTQTVTNLPFTDAAWGDVRRFFHTMAGSAATVGLDEFGARSGSIEEGLERAEADPEMATEALRSTATETLKAILASIEHRVVYVEAAVDEVSDVDTETLADFKDELDDLLEQIEDKLVSLQGGAELGPALEAVYRWIHTLKGISLTVGYTSLAAGLHRVEGQLDEVLQHPDDLASVGFGERLLHAMDRLRHLSRAPKVGEHEIKEIEDLLMGRAGDQQVDERDAPGGVGTTLRVAARRLDILMNLVGELVINRTRMALQLESLADLRGSLKSSQDRLVSLVEGYRQRYEFRDIGTQEVGRSSPEVTFGFSGMEFDRYDDLNILSRSLIEISTDTSEIMLELERIFGRFGAETESFQKITNTLKTEITHIRMVPISRLFRRLARPIRESARAEGKEVRLTTVGGDVEIDRAVLDRLYGCLVHLVRNSVAHGIETAAERRSIGKAEVGVVNLTAFQEGDVVTITVHDDGRGLDKGRIRDAAIALGLEADRSNIEQLIFRPGLSTRAESGEVAGRRYGTLGCP